LHGAAEGACECARSSSSDAADGRLARPRLCATLEALSRRHRERDAGGDLEGGMGHGAGRAAAVLVVSHHGRARLPLHLVLRAVVLLLGAAHAASEAVAALGWVLASTDAVDRDRARLDRCRIRTPALGYRWRTADIPCGIERACVERRGV